MKSLKDITIKEAFFDLDGLLIDSEKVYNVCWVQASKDLGYTITPQMALELRSCDGHLAQSIYEGWFGPEVDYFKIRARRIEIMEEAVRHTPLEIKPGAIDVLKFLNQNGIGVSIVTATPMERARSYVHDVGLDKAVSNVISTKQVSRGKPYPEVYQFACQQRSIEPQSALAFEDSPNGIKSAKGAGCNTVLIPDLTPLDEAISPYVDFCFSSLVEFIKAWS